MDEVVESFDRTHLSRAAKWLGHDLLLSATYAEEHNDITYQITWSEKDSQDYIIADLHVFSHASVDERRSIVQRYIAGMIPDEVALDLMSLATAISLNKELPCHLIDGPLEGRHVRVPRDDFGKPRGEKIRLSHAPDDTLESLLNSIFNHKGPTAAPETTTVTYKRGLVNGETFEWEYRLVQ